MVAVGTRRCACGRPAPCELHLWGKVPARANVTHSASPSPRVRLLSTPAQPLESDMSTTIAGIRFSDQSAALLDHAIAHGFRVEADTRSKASAGVICYSPDGTSKPVTYTERGSSFNKAHFANLRREMLAAGMPPLPGASGEVITSAGAGDGSAFVGGKRASSAEVNALVVDTMLQAPFVLAAPDGRVMPSLDFPNLPNGPAVMQAFLSNLGPKTGLDEAESALFAGLGSLVVAFAAGRPGMISAFDVDALVAAAVKTSMDKGAGELEAALQMASASEDRATAAERRCKSAEERGARTGVLLTELQEKVRVAEDKARRFDQPQSLISGS